MSVLEMISCLNFVVTGGCAYFSNRFYNGFYKVEIESGKTTFLGYFEDEKLSQRRTHKEIFLRDDKIYICPCRGRHVHIWNLTDQTLCSIEIKTRDEKPFLIDEVILGEKCVFFVPNRKEVSIRKMDLESLRVTEVSDKFEIRGTAMSESKALFPFPELVKKSHIEGADRLFWRQVFDKTWYGFMPFRHHMLCYIEGSNKLEITPLEVVNKGELERHLHRVRTELLSENPVPEAVMKLQDFLAEIEMGEMSKTDENGADSNIGKRIWSHHFP